MKKLSWKPSRRGTIYCSTACGGGCTYEQYLNAKCESQNAIKALTTRGWVARVWENLGWHWCLVNKHCGISLHYNGDYWCMMANGEAKMVSWGCAEINSTRSYSNPNRAVREMTSRAEEYFNKQARGLAGLKAISKEGSK